ncbi:MAG: acyl-CoA dehydrogenase family protein [Caulobacteraceae bacterium]|nr:acyl-CoA dehydrogenase family protein [Caulobacteraceae bacterium]
MNQIRPGGFGAATNSPYYGPEHHAWRETLRRWVDKELAPFVNEWDEAETFPRELYKKASDIGLLRLGFPEEYGGVPRPDPFYGVVTSEELARVACGGLIASLMSHGIGAPPIAAVGSEEMKRRVLPGILAGEKISALAITEPSGGSDVANLQTSARRDGDCYVVNGQKMFITSGMRADYYTVAVRTGGPGLGGISLLLIERDTPGFSRTKLDKMGWWCSDTAALYFDDCRVPVANLIGEENQGFSAIMRNFNGERLGMATGAIAVARVAMEEAIAYAKERKTFGKRLADYQVIRHKIVEMARQIAASHAYLEQCAWRVMQGETPVADLAMLKVQATLTLEYCAREAVQIFGGAGYMRGSKVERIYREVRVQAIGGGSEEIMRDLAARQMGL